MKNPLKKLTRTGSDEWREEMERQAAEEIRAASSQRPAEVSEAAWSPPQEAPAPPPATEPRPVHGEESPPVPQRRLTAQQRVAARQGRTS